VSKLEELEKFITKQTESNPSMRFVFYFLFQLITQSQLWESVNKFTFRMALWDNQRLRSRWPQCPAKPETRVETGPEDFIPVLSAHPIVGSDLWSDLPSYPETTQVGAFLVPTPLLPTQPRTYGTKEDRLEDRDGWIDEPTLLKEVSWRMDPKGDRPMT
jgi:hypothetical protein